jgi:class 3 adenylate cyclase/tetratricopeptide (TPR) repeat protein
MRCSKCRTDNPATNNFCAKCGNPLAKQCPKCKADNPLTSDFCGKCGARLEDDTSAAIASVPGSTSSVRIAPESISPEAPEGERKTVTALFADIKGSTELEQDLDPEEARAIVDPALRLMIDAVRRYDGYIVQSTGDGIFALFGAPVAHEDHPQRALYAALRMQEELRRYSAKLVADGGNPLQCRVGVNTGEVVVRSISTGAGNVEYTPIGHTTNLASRMQAVAPVGSIAVAEPTRKLCEGYFTLKPLGPTKVKGVSEPVNVYEVTGLGPLRTRLQRSAGRGLTKFVGRAREMEAMQAAGERAMSGHGQLVAAMAEAGTGKSRLFFEFKAKNQSGWMVLEAFSVSHGKASAYFPVIDLLHSYFKISGEDDQRARRAKVTGNVLTLDRALEDTLPYLFALLGLAEDDDPLEGMDAQIRRRRTLDAIKRLLLRESLNQPLMVIFEDLHWIDEETQGFLNLLADSIATAKILLLVNYRPEYSHQWNSRTYYTQLRLDPLGKESAEEMLTAMVGDGVEVRPLKRLIIEKTEGNPFFMEETVQVLLDEGALVRNGDVKLTKSLNQLKIPPTVQAILAARIDRLAPEDKQLLQAASVIGKDVPWAVLVETAEQPEDAIRRGLGRLQAAELVYETRMFPAPEYTFKHALTHEVAYGSVLQERRRALHARILGVIERVYADRLSEHVDRLAHHAFRGEVWDKALHYLRRIGATGALPSIDTMFGGPESPGYLWVRGEYDRALTVALRDRAVGASFGSFADTVRSNYRLGQIYYSLGDYTSAVDALLRNVELLEGDLRREFFGFAGLPAVLSGSWLALCLAELGRFEEASKHAETAAALARDADDPFSLVVAHVGTGMVALLSGHHTGAMEPLERALVIGRLSYIPLLFPAVAAPLGLAYALDGRHLEGIRLLGEAVERTEAMELGANHALRLVWLGRANALGGNPETARRLGLRALETARRRGERGHEAYALALLGDVTRHAPYEDAETAAEYVRTGLALAETLGMQPLVAALSRTAGEA